MTLNNLNKSYELIKCYLMAELSDAENILFKAIIKSDVRLRNKVIKIQNEIENLFLRKNITPKGDVKNEIFASINRKNNCNTKS